MRQISPITVAGILALVMGGCATGGDTVAPSPSPVAPAATASPPAIPAAAQPFSTTKPLVAQKPDGTGPVPGLIQPTNPDERARQVQAGINAKKAATDPFASLPPIVESRTPAGNSGIRSNPTSTGGSPTATGRSNRTPALPPLPELPRSAPSRSSIARNPSGSPSLPGLPNNSGPTAPTISALPPLPEPTLARQVLVSGVVNVGGVTQAIVKAPNEATSRYVRAGQRLSNGQILVKRIEVNEGSDPVVILEENGIEVARAVGERTNQPQQPGSPTAMEPGRSISNFRGWPA